MDVICVAFNILKQPEIDLIIYCSEDPGFIKRPKDLGNCTESQVGIFLIEFHFFVSVMVPY